MLNWPVDGDYEIVRDSSKDNDIREYLAEFFNVYKDFNLKQVSHYINQTDLTQRVNQELDLFVEEQIRRPSQYDVPPPSVRILSQDEFSSETGVDSQGKEVVVYKIGMKNMRSDPYTGCAYLYATLYCGGINRPDRHLCLHMHHIYLEKWTELSQNNNRKDIRLYKDAADYIYLKDAILTKGQF